jgi:hypothetical protein
MKAVIKYINSFLQQKPKRTKKKEKEGEAIGFFFFTVVAGMYKCMNA